MNIFLSKQSSIVTRITFGWNMFWWNYHVARAREHDRRNVIIEPAWRYKLFIK